VSERQRSKRYDRGLDGSVCHCRRYGWFSRGGVVK